MKTLIRNIGQIVSGDITHPVVDADSLLARDGVIIGLGRRLEDDADLVVDAKGSTVMPGLVDSHVHPVFGDFTPRQRTLDELRARGGLLPVGTVRLQVAQQALDVVDAHHARRAARARHAQRFIVRRRRSGRGLARRPARPETAAHVVGERVAPVPHPVEAGGRERRVVEDRVERPADR